MSDKPRDVTLIGIEPKRLAMLEEKAALWDILKRGKFADPVVGTYCREAVRTAEKIHATKENP